MWNERRTGISVRSSGNSDLFGVSDRGTGDTLGLA